jgi:hypothetical protein
VDAAAFTLRDKGKVTQSQAITATNLNLRGADGNYILTNPSNSIATLAVHTHRVNLRDNTPLTIRKLNMIPGVTATKLVLDDPAGVKQPGKQHR